MQDGRPFPVRDGRDRPYFCIERSDRLRARDAGARSVPTDLRTLHGTRVHRVELAHPQEAPRLRERLHHAGGPTYEADVRFAYRYLIDRGIRSAVRIQYNLTDARLAFDILEKLRLVPLTVQPAHRPIRGVQQAMGQHRPGKPSSLPLSRPRPLTRNHPKAIVQPSCSHGQDRYGKEAASNKGS